MTLSPIFPVSVRPARSVLATLVAGTCLAGPAFALTPDELWEQNRAYLEASGYTVDADISRDGDDLTVDELRLTVTTEIEDGEDLSMVLTMSDMTYAARGDDEVELVLPASMPMTLEADSDEGPFSVEMTLTAEGLSQLFSGTPGDVAARYEADEIGVTVDSVTGPDDVVLEDMFAVLISGASGTARIASTDGFDIEQAFTADMISYRFDLIAPEESGEEGEVHATGSFAGTSFGGTLFLPAAEDGKQMDPASMLSSGMRMDTTMAHTGGEMQMSGSSDGEEFSFGQTSAGGQLIARLADEGLHYDVSGTDIAMQLQSDDLPFPVQLSLAEAGFGLTMPLAASEEPSPLGLRITLRDAVVPEGLWAMVDPTGALPHEPLTVDARLSGAARLFHDLTDAEALEDMDPGEAPGELTSLNLDMLELKAGGAALQAEGQFDIDNTVQSQLNPDMPKATGTLEVTAQGVMGLIQTLGEMGLIPADQAMMAPMMVGMFARQVSGPDDLASTIEITEDESLLVNGNPMTP
ncbi:hypothetical protein PSM7751_03678 [Pseudooceanicola marinus]|uniref:DUF2125 domain-containing protein n=1 Tax=Pseudooceanicola marinus TaxID=396013 RepID=A0A1X7A3S9_9RHOB|nr:DUF2125 domain-containing protein [Pseudooceanicola marinus]PJE31146.1 hypothetical protein CVM50_08210 [Pseudooceanicola marinus]SLN69345.1 hypothetical protein PSM7751_03678 [Pseudooceanicola marinus]